MEKVAEYIYKKKTANNISIDVSKDTVIERCQQSREKTIKRQENGGRFVPKLRTRLIMIVERPREKKSTSHI